MRRRTVLAMGFALPLFMLQGAHARERITYHGVGIVNRVEPLLGIINLSHGPVQAAGWSTMTHDLHVKPKELLRGLTPGMQVRFRVSATDPMTYVITAIEPVK